MFLKLFKYNFKRTGRYGVPILIILALLGVVCALNTGLMVKAFQFTTETQLPEDDVRVIFSAMFSMFSLLGEYLFIILISICSGAVIIAVLVHFYKNVVSDEAYLTFTLPVKNGQIQGAHLLSGFLWMTISGAVVVLDFVLSVVTFILALGVSFDELAEVFEEFVKVFEIADIMQMAGLLVMTLVMGLFSSVFELLLHYTAVLLGGVVVKKHRALAAVGFVVGINAIASAVFGVLSFVLAIVCGFVSMMSPFISQIVLYGITTVASVGGSIGVWFLNGYLMKRINLS